MAHQLITHAELLARLHYDPATGVWTWLPSVNRTKAWNSHYAGKRAGSVGNGGYRCVRIDKNPYQSCRLAWFYMTGVWLPAGRVDHENRVRDDDRWSNLREATKTQQNANRGLLKSSQSGIKGATFRRGHWEVNITVAGKCIYLGQFSTVEEAASAYRKAATDMFGEFANHGPR